jgi:hypothetical protein
MWRIVGLAGWLAYGTALAATPGPTCVADEVEGCVKTMKNVFSTVEQTRAYCTKAARKTCVPETQEQR